MKSLRNEAELKADRRKRIWRMVLGIIVIFLFLEGSYYIGSVYKRESIEVLRQAVKRAAVECYSVEGMYPPTVDYLKENDYLTYDDDKYYIHYETFAENVMPVIEVYEKTD